MHETEISEKLLKILKKLYKKDRARYHATLKKMEEITRSDPQHYKNLCYDLKDFKEVHIDSHFVLIFKVEGRTIKFEDLQHHDVIF